MEAVFALETLEQLRAAGVGEVYEALERSECPRLFTARVERQLVGYCAYFVKRNPHYKSSWQALQDLVVMLPEHREALPDLITFAEHELRSEGVQVIYHHANASPILDGAVLERMGYEVLDHIWAKRLDRS
jgi:hypothetical protein